MIPEFAEQTDEMLDQGAVISLRLAHDQPSVKVPLAELTWIEEDLIIFRSLDAEDNTWEFRFGFAEESGGHALVFYARDGAVLGSLRLMEDIPEYKAQGTSARLFRARIKSDLYCSPLR